MKRNTLGLSATEIDVQAIEKDILRLERNALPVIRSLMTKLVNAENTQAVFDEFGNSALEVLLAVKKIAQGIEELGNDVPQLPSDFAIPVLKDGKPTGELIYNPLQGEEGNDVEET